MLKDILPMFPENINTFIDLFAGACNVGINVKANKVMCNDYIEYLPQLFMTWQNKDIKDINQYIDDTISKWNLSATNQIAFEDFRKHYNATKNIEDLFILLCYSFNYQMRFNNSHEYNSSFGKAASTMNGNIRNNINLFTSILHNKNIEFTNKDFRDVNMSDLSKNDFVYCDPPYLISGAVYQDGKRGFKGWNQQDDIDLFSLLDGLNSREIKFAMSNMLESKGKSNDYLIIWAQKYKTHYLKVKYSGSNYQRTTDGKDIEVLITNY